MTTETTEKEYAGKGVAGTGLGLGIAGTALGLLAGGGSILGLNKNSSTPNYVTKEEFNLNTKLMEKDGEIALLKADKYTDAKLLETYSLLNDKIAKLNDKVDSNRDRSDDKLYHQIEKVNGRIDCNKGFQDQVNAQQGIWNATNTATIACMQSQIAQLQGMTKLVIPNASCCPGWGSVTITPTGSSTLSS